MSEEFEKIKNEVNGFRQDAENKIELEKRAVEERIKKEKLILEKSGVRQLFEEIRDNRLVELSSPSTYTVRVHKSFGREYDEEKIEYHPAEIEESIGTSSLYGVSLVLRFNYHYRPGGEHLVPYTIQVAVVKGELCLLEAEGTYTSIKEGELATVIAKALKNPLER